MSLLSELRRRGVIRVAAAYCAGAWLLVQVAETVISAYELPTTALPVLITVLAVGLVPALAVAWAFELTAEGLKRDPGAETGPAPLRGARTADRVILVLLALGIGYFAVDKFVFDPIRDQELIDELLSASDKSIAVLPFDDMSQDRAQQYFSDGIAEEILNLLARLPDLRVISRSSSFAYRDEKRNVPKIAEELDVTFVLEGSVRTHGNAVRVTAQLIDGATDMHLWSETYDEEFGDIFAIQDAIAGEIVDKLKIHVLQAQPRSRRTSPQAYELYLRANHLVREQRRDFGEALALTQEVLAIDPDYVPALTLQSLIYYAQPELAPPGRGVVLNRETIARALAIDPGDGIANAYHGWLAIAWDADIAAGVRHANIAATAEPQNAEVLRVLGGIALMLGRFDEAIAVGERAINRNPACGWCNGTMFQTTYLAGDYARAERYARRIMQEPDYQGQTWLAYANLLIAAGRHSEASDYLGPFEADAWWPAEVKRALAICHGGDAAQAAARLGAMPADVALDEPQIRFRVVLDAAATHACLGNSDRAFEALEETRALSARIEHPPVRTMADVVWSPLLAPLHGDPRWAAFRTSVGLGEEQLAGAELAIPDDTDRRPSP